MKVSNSFVLVLCSVVSVGALSACGRNTQTYPEWANQSTTSGLQSSTTSSLSQAQQCSTQPNFNAAVSSYTSSTDFQYRGCKASRLGGSSTSMALFPADGQTKNVCVFPVQFVNNSASVIVNNPYAALANRFVLKCVTVAGTGSEISFSGVNFQGALVVNYNDANSFLNCVASGNLTYCAQNMGIQFSAGSL